MRENREDVYNSEVAIRFSFFLHWLAVEECAWSCGVGIVCCSRAICLQPNCNSKTRQY